MNIVLVNKKIKQYFINLPLNYLYHNKYSFDHHLLFQDQYYFYNFIKKDEKNRLTYLKNEYQNYLE